MLFTDVGLGNPVGERILAIEPLTLPVDANRPIRVFDCLVCLLRGKLLMAPKPGQLSTAGRSKPAEPVMLCMLNAVVESRRHAAAEGDVLSESVLVDVDLASRLVDVAVLVRNEPRLIRGVGIGWVGPSIIDTGLAELGSVVDRGIE